MNRSQRRLHRYRQRLPLPELPIPVLDDEQVEVLAAGGLPQLEGVSSTDGVGQASPLNHRQRRIVARSYERGLRRELRHRGPLTGRARAAVAALAASLALLFSAGANPADAAITVTYTGSSAVGTLTITSDAASEIIALSCVVDGFVNYVVLNGDTVGQVPHGAGGGCQTISGMTVNGGGGNDTLIFNHSSMAMYTGLGFGGLSLDGGAGNDNISVERASTVVGGAGADTIVGGAGAQTISGGDGADSINAGDGADLIDGGIGNDTIVGGAGNDTIDYSGAPSAVVANLATGAVSGGSGADTLTGIENAIGSPFADSITAGAAPTSMVGGAGNDTLTSSANQPSTLAGGDGHDSLVAPAGTANDNLAGGEGNDTLSSAAGDDTLVGGGGNDSLIGGSGNDSLAGGDGNDTLAPGTGTGETVNGGAGTDALSGSGSGQLALTNTVFTAGAETKTITSIEQASLTGGPVADSIVASSFTAGPASLYGLNGGDTLIGNNLGGVLDGGNGADSLVGGNLADTLEGGGDNDTLTGGAGADLINGGDGNDVINAGAGADTVDAGAGNDTVGGGAGPGDSLAGGSGTDSITAGNDATSMNGGSESDTLVGGNGADNLAGGPGSDLLTGGQGNDTLDGQADGDTLEGGAGNDVITDSGASGIDLLRHLGGVAGGHTITNNIATGLGTDTLAGIDRVSLTSPASGVLLDLSGFTAGPVTVVGNVPGGSQTIAGTNFADSLAAASGNGRLIHRVVSSAVATPTQITDGVTTDTISGFNSVSIIGSSSGDLIDTSDWPVASTISGGSGGDTIRPSATGNDSIDGGTGIDRLELPPLPVAMGMVITDNSLVASGYGTDTLAEIEFVSVGGSDGNDTLDAGGFGGRVHFAGDAGNDSLVAGQGTGAQTLDGGAGTMDLAVRPPAGSQTVNNAAITGTDGTVSIPGIERVSVSGGAGNDLIIATAFTAGPVSMAGGAGHDTLLGGPGNDSLAGETGNDLINPGLGANQASGGDGNDTLVYEEDSNVTLGAANIQGTNGFGSVVGIEAASISGGSGANLITAAAFAGSVTLDGQGGADTLIAAVGASRLDGGLGNDRLQPGPGSDQLIGGDGTDEVRQSVNANQTLTDVLLTGQGQDTLSGIETASLAAGAGANQIDISGFSGNSTVDAADGNDTIVASAGADSLNGGAGTNRLVHTADGNQTLAGAGITSNTLVNGEGTHTLTSLVEISLVGSAGPNLIEVQPGRSAPVTLTGLGGNDTLAGGAESDSLIGGDGIDAIIALAGGQSLLTAGSFVRSGGDSDTLSSIEQATLEGGGGADSIDASPFPGTVALFGTGGSDTLIGPTADGPHTLDGGSGFDQARFSGAGNMTITNTGVPGIDLTLVDVEAVSATGSAGADTIDASAFTGQVTMLGQGSDDSLVGTQGTDSISGGAGNDTIVPMGNTAETVDAGPGNSDLLIHAQNESPIQIGPTSLVAGPTTKTISGFEQASLSGGAGQNLMNATNFDGPVTLDGLGGNDTLIGSAAADLLIGGGGNDRVSQSAVDSDISLSDTLLTGRGPDQLSGIEEAAIIVGPGANRIDVTGFSGLFDIDAGGGNDTIEVSNGDGYIDAGAGTDLVHSDSIGNQALFAGFLQGEGREFMYLGVEAFSLTGSGADETIIVSGFAGPVSIAAGGGIDSLGAANPGVHAHPLVLDGGPGSDTLIGGTANDTLTGGPGADSILGNGGSNLLVEQADADISLTEVGLAGIGGDTVGGLAAAALTGGPSANIIDVSLFPGQSTIVGGAGDDVLVVSGGSDSVDGGAGTDRIVQTAAGDRTLVPASLQHPLGNHQIASVEAASLTGTEADEAIDASTFAGSVTLSGEGGDDTLRAGSGGSELQGGEGADSLFGGAGIDVLDAGDGDDILDSRTLLGTDADSNLCGPGNDSVFANPVDTNIDCELVEITDPTPPPPAKLTLGGAKKQIAKGGKVAVRLTVRCTDACASTVSGVVKVVEKVRKGGKTRTKRSKIKIAKVTRAGMNTGQTYNVVLRISKKNSKKLKRLLAKKGGKATVQVKGRASSVGGQSQVVKRNVKLVVKKKKKK